MAPTSETSPRPRPPLTTEGADAAFRDLAFADEVEAVAASVGSVIDAKFDEASRGVGRRYRSRTGFSDEELEEYGLKGEIF